ncbi:sensor histidine kinase [Corticicoccus populi]|uniref:histidine kinase n=1 Tax=Corticicoccus populi TaxID=1812821 RepID=A0ABW5WUK8_9STAP
MKEWYYIFARNTGLNLYIWLLFCILPFYFIFRSNTTWEIAVGIVVTMLFFAVFWMSYRTHGVRIYIGLSLQFVMNIVMSVLYGYVYFSLFIAFYVGHIKSRSGFITMYVIHLVTTTGAVTLGFFNNFELFLGYLPFLIMTILGVILIPINIRNRIRQEALEVQLDDANQKIAELAIIEERHRIARDLHDTLGQKLSVIGLKSELSRKLMDKDPEAAKKELHDIEQSSRLALKEVREMVSDMKKITIHEELNHIQQLLKAADIRKELIIEADISRLPALIENVLSMCLKEAVNNVVKHSGATECMMQLVETEKDFHLKVTDNGKNSGLEYGYGNGLDGMKERLSFINGEMDTIKTIEGFEVNITIPKVLKQIGEIQ